jgi:membrane protein
MADAYEDIPANNKDTGITYEKVEKEKRKSEIKKSSPNANDKSAKGILKKVFQRWGEEEPFRLAAVVSYYAIFSLPGLLVVILNIAGMIFGEKAVRGQLKSSIEGTVGPNAAESIQEMLANAQTSGDNTLMTIVSIGILIFAATGVFYHLKLSLNEIWNVRAKPEAKGFMFTLKSRAASLSIVLVIAFLLVVSLIASSIITAIGDNLSLDVSATGKFLLKVASIVVSLGLNTLLFAAIYKVLPDVKIKWKEVWVGGLITAILFEIGKFLISLYIGKANPGDAYGAAGSIIVILTWVSYTSVLIFLGAIFTQVYADTQDEEIEPEDYAVRDTSNHAG